MDGTASETGSPGLSLTFAHAPAGWGRLFLLALLGAALTLLMVPFWLIGTHLVTDPAARAVVAARPQAALSLGLGLVLLFWIFGWPLAAHARCALGRRITIAGGLVRAEGRGLFGPRAWVEPLASYAGVAHRVRSSLSGIRHELILVHRRPSRSVLLLASSQISQETVEAAARLFALAEIPSREAARLAPLHGFFPLAEPQPQLAAVLPALAPAGL